MLNLSEPILTSLAFTEFKYDPIFEAQMNSTVYAI